MVEEPFWIGFLSLHRARTYYGGDILWPAAIPFSEIDAYAKRQRLNDEDFEQFLHVISTLDDKWLELEKKEIKKHMDEAKRKMRSRRR